MRRFTRLSATDTLPEESTLMRFRRLPGRHNLGPALLKFFKRNLHAKGLLLPEGAIVDAKLFAASPSTSITARAHDPEMPSSKRGNQWHFGMKLHMDGDDKPGTVPSSVMAAGNVSRSATTDQLMRGEKRRVFDDAGHAGIEQREEHAGHHVRWRITVRPGVRLSWAEDDHRQKVERNNTPLPGTRAASVPHQHCCGLEKNAHRLRLTPGPNYLHRHRKELLAG